MNETDMLARLKSVALESAWNTLNRLGYSNQFCEGLQVIRPDLEMVGRALTVRCLPIRPDLQETLRQQGPALNARAAEETQAGDVLVIDSGGETGAGFLGDVIAAKFLANGGAGIVCDGAVRDLHVLRQMPLPLYIKGAHAAGVNRRLVPADLNIPVRCGNVTILPGDYLKGDSQGVLVIPAALLEQVVTEAEATDHKELYLRRKIEAGASIYGVYPPNEETMREYEAYRREGGQ